MSESSKQIEANIKILCYQDYYTEGPVADSAGTIYFTTLAGCWIKKITPEGNITDWARSSCPNGQFILSDGSHLVCDSRSGSLFQFDASGRSSITLVEKQCAGTIVNVPNDVIADNNGNIFFSDSVRYKGNIFLIRKDRSQHIFISDLDYPNGIALSADQTRMYVAESYKNRVWCFCITTGKPEAVWCRDLPYNLSGKEVDNLPDGLAVDSKGFIYVAHYGMSGIQRLSPGGELAGFIHTGVPLTSNLTFLQNSLIVTGGYAEPGPGVVLSVSLNDISL